ncbi:hypothetical protein N7509_005126 [Penicillium cosmopolitanum]|uniref:Transcription factor domain-containing protein n=1 Tax=Penicillium cosmopolitanum TaxID=1131564 RepID=A0A9W9W1L0_9EURO|nr:uncharacterized protein N7509_005126 [Penicillium cosmopolitanum]KAJ5397013.1 hypothetical protein N7509_005126 [Penicillium cosmopolitanum]
MQDLKLLQHYILHTSMRMTLNPEKALVWKIIIPDIASGAEYLMHLLLALAGVDMLTNQLNNPNLTKDNDSLTRLVISHHQKGLKGFQQEIQSHQESNSEELLTGTFLINAFAFASLRVGDLAPSDSPVATTDALHGAQEAPEWPRSQWLHLIRVSFSLGGQYWMHLQRGRLRSLLVFNKSNDDWKNSIPDLVPLMEFSKGTLSAKFAAFSSNAIQAISDLRASSQMLKATITPPSGTPDSGSGVMNPTYCQNQDNAIDVVETMFMRILHVLCLRRTGAQPSPELEIQSEIEDAAIASWPTLVDGGFISSLDLTGPFDSAQGLSLAILAHLYLTLALLDKIWYFGGTFDTEIRKIAATIVNQSYDDGIVALMKWPMHVIEQ